jgi:hypothetical protein
VPSLPSCAVEINMLEGTWRRPSCMTATVVLNACTCVAHFAQTQTRCCCSQAHNADAKAAVIQNALVGSIGAAHCTDLSGGITSALVQHLADDLDVPRAWLAEARACWAASTGNEHAQLSALLECESQQAATSLLMSRVAAPLAATAQWDQLSSFVRLCQRPAGPHAASALVLRVRLRHDLASFRIRLLWLYCCVFRAPPS